MKKCPYCNNKPDGTDGNSICLHYNSKTDDGYYSCDNCKAEWKEITKEVLVKRIRIN